MTAPVPPPVPPRPVPPRATRSFGVLVRMATVFLLVLLLLIPLGLIRSVLRERLQRRDEAVAGITSTWGGNQVLVGPVLVVPYRYTQKTLKDRVVNGRVERVEAEEPATARAFFLPASLTVTGTLGARELHRGIYDTVVYDGAFELTASFEPPAFDGWGVAPGDVQWADASIHLSVTDLRGTKEALVLLAGDRAFDFVPGTRLPGFSSGVHARTPDLFDAQEAVTCRVAVTLNGSAGLRIAPVGRDNAVELASGWPHPSFQGAFLPESREVRPDGFDARWRVSYYGRSFPQQWTDRREAAGLDPAAVHGALFGVDLASTVDAYRSVERSIKYGILFVVLVFTAFFLFEVLARVRVHPFQYALVGVALCLFYLGLLSLSEFVAFGRAYAAAAAASSLLVTLYSAKALRSGRRSVLVAAILAGIYGFLFVTLRLQDYSLLMGTAGLFAVLGIVMYVTRNIDWYEEGGAVR